MDWILRCQHGWNHGGCSRCHFLLVFFNAPRYGLLSGVLRRSALMIQIGRDDVLGMTFRFHEPAPTGSPPIKVEDLHGALRLDFR